MNFVIVPFKNFVDAKSRLRKDISDKQTRKIVKIMLEHVLAEIKKCSDSFEKYLVTKDEEAIKIAQSQGIKTLIEKKQFGESASIDWASKKLHELGATSVLRIPGDLPLIKAEDINEIFEVSNKTNSSILVPSNSGLGTNAILRKPPGVIPSFFGPNSMKKHVAAFKEQGANYSIVKNSNIAFDVDTNEDVESLKTLSEKSPTVISILNLIN